MTRRVQYAPGSVLTVTEGAETWFRGEVVPPNENTDPYDEGPPRERPHHVMKWPVGTLGPGIHAPTRPSERVEAVEGATSRAYELLGLPRQLHVGRRRTGVEVAVMPVEDLYPYTGVLQEQGGEEVLPEIQLAMWNADSARLDRGQYYTYDGEAPFDLAEQLVASNRQVVVNGTTFRIMDPFEVLQVPRVRFTLRGARV